MKKKSFQYFLHNPANQQTDRQTDKRNKTNPRGNSGMSPHCNQAFVFLLGQCHADITDGDPEVQRAMEEMRRLDEVLFVKTCREKEVKRQRKEHQAKLWQDLQVDTVFVQCCLDNNKRKVQSHHSHLYIFLQENKPQSHSECAHEALNTQLFLALEEGSGKHKQHTSNTVQVCCACSHCDTSQICFFALKGKRKNNKRRTTMCLSLKPRFLTVTVTDNVWSKVSYWKLNMRENAAHIFFCLLQVIPIYVSLLHCLDFALDGAMSSENLRLLFIFPLQAGADSGAIT